jgi:hypothetical protein
VGAEIVEDHDVVGLEGRNEELFDVGVEGFAVDRPVEQAGRFDAVVSQGGEEKSRSSTCPAGPCRRAAGPLAPSRVGGSCCLRPGFIDEDQSPWIDEPLIGSPPFAVATYVRAIPLLREEGLFLNVTPIRRKKRLIIEVSALTPRSAERRSHRA